MKNIFASFATDNLAEQRDRLCDSALEVGFDSVCRWSPNDFIGTDFYCDNINTLSLSRGAGYWLWKPYLILQKLKSMNPEDMLVYCDAGRSTYYSYALKKYPSKLDQITRNSEQGYLLGPKLHQHGKLSRWTKRDCLKILEMDRLDILNEPTIQATWSFWTPTQQALDFLEEWLRYAMDPRCLTDIGNVLGEGNYDEFVEHRHDQSIMTLLAYKRNSRCLDFKKSGLFFVLGLRPNSALSNMFLRRIDDSEKSVNGFLWWALFWALFELKFKKRISIFER